jgi:hypothetical protein
MVIGYRKVFWKLIQLTFIIAMELWDYGTDYVWAEVKLMCK